MRINLLFLRLSLYVFTLRRHTMKGYISLDWLIDLVNNEYNLLIEIANLNFY